MSKRFTTPVINLTGNVTAVIGMGEEKWVLFQAEVPYELVPPLDTTA